MKVLFIGDVVGRPGRRAVREILSRIKEGYDLIIANGENSAGGLGITPKVADELFSYGVNIITTGNHVWKEKEIYDYLDKEPRILRPANYPEGTPGRGWGIYELDSGVKLCVVNLMGRVFMAPLENPFRTIDAILERVSGEVKIVIVDFHAEATSEKVAMGWYLDGRVSAVIGTHTHVQTADERVLPNGTAYITDAGMTGPFDSIIGMKKDAVIRRYLTMLPVRFEVAKGDVMLCGVEIEIDDETGKALSIKRVRVPLDEVDLHGQPADQGA
ncbi:TIGR00282 family metallophosphoesterase [Candidatus Poribacteria bacterium]|nr:MAG: TIGR00282 family metallophosphoesterase [Candidatus Poribacteria bacterium]